MRITCWFYLHQDLLHFSESLLPQIPASRQQFFKNHLITQTKFNLYGSLALNYTSTAFLILANKTSVSVFSVAPSLILLGIRQERS
jgi:hypothetical protein